MVTGPANGDKLTGKLLRFYVDMAFLIGRGVNEEVWMRSSLDREEKAE